MTSTQRIKAGIIVAGVFVGATVCLLLTTPRSQPHSLSLVFERYGRITDFSLNDQEVAFLWFTNSSDRSYCLPMMGGTNTFQRDSPIGYDHGSYLVAWEFGDQAHVTPPVSFASLGLCQVVAPHSAVRIRVPLPLRGEHRKVAVLCAEMPSVSPRRFWAEGIGWSILRVLPRSVGMKLLLSQPAVLRVWCDRELSHPDKRPAK